MVLRSNTVASRAASCTIFFSSAERPSQVFLDISSTQALYMWRDSTRCFCTS